MELTFENDYKAYLNYNSVSRTYTVALYSPEGLFLASSPYPIGLPLEEKSFKASAEALMNGYFSGWRNCKRIMKKSISSACEIEMPK